ncbi:lipopolysaccharide biosynthesis protein [Spirosoma lituiforme]
MYDQIIRKNDADERSQIVRMNIFFSFVVKIFSVLVNFLLIPLTLNLVSKHDFSIWMMINSLVMWFTIFDVSFGQGLRNKLVACFSDGNLVLAKKYISTFYFIMAIFTLALILFISLSNFYINWASILNIDIRKVPNVNYIITIMLCSLCLQVFLKPINSVLLADQKAFLSTLLLLLSNLTIILLILLLTQFFRGSLLLLVTIQALAPLIVYSISSMILFRYNYKNIRPEYSFITYGLWRNLFSTGGKFMVIQLGNIVLFSAGNFILSHLLDVNEVGPYNVANRYFSAILILHGILLTPYWSAFTEAYIKKDRTWIIETIKKLNIISGCLVVLCALLFSFSDFAFKIWTSGKIAIPQDLSFALAVNVSVYLFMNNYNYYSSGTNNINYLAILSLFQVIMYLPFSIVMVKYLNFGASGIVWSVTTFYTISLIFGIVQYKKSVVKLVDS